MLSGDLFLHTDIIINGFTEITLLHMGRGCITGNLLIDQNIVFIYIFSEQ